MSTDAPSRPSPALLFAVVGALAALIAGLVLARPDVIAIGVPLALWAAHALSVSGVDVDIEIEKRSSGDEGWVHDDILVGDGTELVDVSIIQADRRRRRVVVAGGARLRAASRALHSGPLRSVEVAARGMQVDGAQLGRPSAGIVAVHAVPPAAPRLPRMPLAPRLTGLHGSHEGTRPGQGGDFRDIHPFAPGDELRRVDWKATARAARRPGELLIRRTNALSDASAVIVMDTADDLGAMVSTWGTTDLRRSGATSLDHARSAARAIAEATVAQGDRVAFHTLALSGRSVRSGGGRRHLARVVAEIAASGRAGDDSRFRRTPPVPHGSIIHVLSVFFDGAAAEIALRWRAGGHRVIAVDVLPELDRARLSMERMLALQVLLAERHDMLRGLEESGVEVVRWDADRSAVWTALSRVRAQAVGVIR
ncbi:DUF58 domain-containing protein [Microbacterium esteraromaticum]|uniref:DUF58 domain-containing protein n=1 Tax=Microbacterium esteraromaticum TaxID=57043 RepID=A0A7D8AIG5_9MICO|nr:DUF58 domain-containing protein [Microbacterium esteraromaticum]QMU98423.1 DUF58 domain-containing protein [Microbacterium esteraromaticum]